MTNDRKQRPAVDPKVYELAEYFLDGLDSVTEDDLWELAGVIQTACEDALRDIEKRLEQPQ